MTNKISSLALAISVASLSSTALASGFLINEQSASGVGTAYAGRAAVVEDASTVFYNPAGMSKLTRAELSAGGTYLNVKGDFSNGSRTNPAGVPSAAEAGAYENGGDFIPNKVIPFVYYATPINDNFAAGFGIFVPYGTGSDYSKKAYVGGFAGETELQVINFQPTISYKILDNLSIGAGLDIAYAKGKLTKQLDLVPYVPGNPVLGQDAYKGYENTFEVEGDDMAYGFNLGLMWDISDATTLGVTYRSAMKITLEGDAKFSNNEGVMVFNQQLASTPFAQNGLVFADLAADVANGVSLAQVGANYAQGKYTGHVANQGAEVPLEGPQTATISLAHRLTDNLQLQGGVTWADWSSFEYFDVKGKGPGTISALGGLGQNYIGHIVEKWSDTYSYALGATYTVNDQWLLRAGFAYDESPVSNEHRTARVPDNDRKWLTLGARYAMNQDLSFDLGAAYLFMSDSNLNEVDHNLDSTQDGPANAKGTYSMDAFGLALQMNYRM